MSIIPDNAFSQPRTVEAAKAFTESLRTDPPPTSVSVPVQETAPTPSAPVSTSVVPDNNSNGKGSTVTTSIVPDTSLNLGILDGLDDIYEAMKKDWNVSSCPFPTGELFKVGRPVCFPQKIDPGLTVSRYLHAKMSVTDLIPCRFRIPFTKLVEQYGEKEPSFRDLLPELVYDSPINEFKKQCQYHGLSDKFIGLRLYSTDESSAADTFSNTYTENVIAETLNNKVRNSKIGEIGRSVVGSAGDHTQRAVSNAVKRMGNFAGDKIGEWGDSLISAAGGEKGGVVSNIFDMVGNAAHAAMDIIPDMLIMGNKISMPKIWDSSDYSPSFEVACKLVSPYGDPQSIKEFITKPFLMLLILMGPKTSDGLTYGRPFSLTVNGYGNSFIPLAQVTSISFNRGGGETAYNIYKQPLVIDVRLGFQGLCSGFGVMAPDNKLSSEDKNIFADAANPKTSVYFKGKTMFHTLGHVVESLKPMPLEYPLKSRLTGQNATISSSGSSFSSSGGFGGLGSLLNIATGVGGLIAGGLSIFSGSSSSAKEIVLEQKSTQAERNMASNMSKVDIYLQEKGMTF
jgi:hypothetical protein